MQQKVENLMKTTMENIKNMIDVNTIVGDAVETKDGSVIIPISKVSFAFVAGGGDLPTNNKSKETVDDTEYQLLPFAGGTGAGVTVQPIGFLTTSNGQIRMLPVNYSTTVDRIIDLVPNFIENIDGMLHKKSAYKENIEDEERV